MGQIHPTKLIKTKIFCYEKNEMDEWKIQETFNNISIFTVQNLDLSKEKSCPMLNEATTNDIDMVMILLLSKQKKNTYLGSDLNLWIIKRFNRNKKIRFAKG